jgi:hypothetical protein
VAGDASQVVWHVQGSVELTDHQSRLILTERDYDDVYLEDTPASRQLQSLLAQRRVVFIGFGFQDAELLRVLKRVGRLTTPARPLFAFLPDMIGPDHQVEIAEYLDKYNVDIVSYRTQEGSHEQLQQRLNAYKSFTVRRSMNYGRPALASPSFDPQTTSLLIYNELCMVRGRPVGADVAVTLMRARLLSQLRFSRLRRSALLEDLMSRVRPLTGRSRTESTGANFDSIVHELVDQGLLELGAGDDPEVSLTAKGVELVASQAATSSRVTEQFRESLRSRAEAITTDAAVRDRLSSSTEAFFKECVDQRALGVALAIGAPTERAKSYHIIGLLQALHQYMEQMQSEDEAIELSKLVQTVLAKPSEAERRYLGVALQAQFGVHLLGMSPDAIVLRSQELADTAFLLDSTTLIPFLARSSIGHQGSTQLVSVLKRAGATVFTTYLLGVEVAEHARWALQNIGGNLINVEGLRAATGRSGFRSNGFLDGLLEEVSRGESHPDLMTYVADVCRCPPGSRTCRNDDVRDALNHQGVPCLGFEEFPGFERELLVDRDEKSEEIAALRQERGSYRHERQVRAEAEALVVVRGLRSGLLALPDKRASNAFFVSHTRVVDQAAGGGHAITIRHDAVLQWINTLMPGSLDELGALTDLLLYELVESGIEIVDQTRLQTTFAPLINASKEKLPEELEKHRARLPAVFGEDPEAAFRDTGSIDVPLMLEGLYAQRAETLEVKVGTLQRRAEAAETRGRLTEAQKQELERLKREKSERRRKEQKRRRAAESRPKTKRRRRK